MITKIINKAKQLTPPTLYKKSYSQLGEDLVIDFMLEMQGISKPFYLDIGSNDPEHYSNTNYFYLKGSSGICIEPNPALVSKHKAKRGRDEILQVGISPDQSTVADYYVMNWHPFNTFDKEQAEQVEKNYEGRNNILKVEKIKLMSVNELLTTVVGKREIDILSLDIEGFDLKILQAWDFKNHSPKIICVEIYDPKTKEQNTEIGDLLESNGYKKTAENMINGIYLLN